MKYHLLKILIVIVLAIYLVPIIIICVVGIFLIPIYGDITARPWVDKFFAPLSYLESHLKRNKP